MKKTILMLAVIAMAALGFKTSAQNKFAMVDMEYIMKNIPSFEMAQEQLNQLSDRYQREVEDLNSQAKQLYQQYLNDKVFMTDDQVKRRETEILEKEKEVTALRYKYFGPEGELYKRRQSLLKPIQDEVYNAVKKVADERGYQAIFDRASASDIIYASPRIDVSNEVLAKMGYAN